MYKMISFQGELPEENDEEGEEKKEAGYFKDEDQYPYLPFPYIIELIKDLS